MTKFDMNQVLTGAGALRAVGRVVRDDAAPPTCERLWTVDDLSAFLGVPVGTLYQWRHKGEGPPGMRLGKHLRFDPDRVRAWVALQDG